jgi:antitoxin component YwqK of YwqJK toxin-antitoxin module
VFVAFFIGAVFLKEALLRQPSEYLWCAKWHSSMLAFFLGLLIGNVLYPTPTIAGNRIVKEDSDNDTKTDRIVHLSPSGDIIKLEADTNYDRKMDTFQYYKHGVVERIERDTTGDGQIDQTIRFDDQRRPVESRHDLDKDGRMETFRRYKNGELCRQESFAGGRTKPDVVTEFVKGQAVLVQRDLNQDGAFDLLVRMVKGTPMEKEEDRNHDGRMDRFTAYDDQGRPLSVREFATDPKETDLKKPVKITRFKHGELCSVTQIDNGKTVITRFLNDKPVRQTIDEDRDGQPEQTIIYNKQGKIDSAFSDTNRDGRSDVWQYYRRGALYRTEQDRNHDQEVDAKSEYDAGRLVRLIMDNDADGHFETGTIFDSAKGTKVTELIDQAGRLKQRLSYLGKVLRKKELFDTKTGRLSNLEEFDQAGKIVMSKEAQSKTGVLNLTWRYDAEENAVAAEKDTDGDGVTDIWYHYENGRIKKVEEDRNKDGKPDLWETYDAAQAVVCQSEDLDFDGTVDIERRH